MEQIKISISSDAVTGAPPLEEMVRTLRRAGFGYSELSIADSFRLAQMPRREWSAFRSFAESEGLKFRQGHLKNAIDVSSADEKKRTAAIDILKLECELYAELGVTAGVLHVGGWEALYEGVPPEKCAAARRCSLRELEDFTREMPVTVCLENLPDTAPGADSLLEMLRLAEVEKIGICLDTGHLNLAGRNPGAFIDACGARLLALHLNDNAGTHDRNPDRQGFWYADDLHLYPGFHKEAVNWAEVKEALGRNGYRGLWNFEVPGEFRVSPAREWSRFQLRRGREIGRILFENQE